MATTNVLEAVNTEDARIFIRNLCEAFNVHVFPLQKWVSNNPILNRDVYRLHFHLCHSNNQFSCFSLRQF